MTLTDTPSGWLEKATEQMISRQCTCPIRSPFTVHRRRSLPPPTGNKQTKKKIVEYYKKTTKQAKKHTSGAYQGKKEVQKSALFESVFRVQRCTSKRTISCTEVHIKCCHIAIFFKDTLWQLKIPFCNTSAV